jgi:hypothetical protein
VPGVRFIDGPFIGFRANFNLNFTRGCTVGEVDNPRVTVKDSDPGGGCTLSSSTKNPLSRGDIWLLIGLIGALGFYVSCRRHPVKR